MKIRASRTLIQAKFHGAVDDTEEEDLTLDSSPVTMDVFMEPYRGSVFCEVTRHSGHRFQGLAYTGLKI
jgi:hypothetical protein